MHIVLVRPPRYVWPFNSETSAFWQPLGLISVAAAVRHALPWVTVEVIDAPALKMGWKTLEDRLRARRIDVLGIGEETVSAHEGIRAAALAKRLHPDCLVVAGGYFYCYSLASTFASGVVDAIVHGEGEETFTDLVRNAGDRATWPQVNGISYQDADGQIRTTRPRALIKDLDTLPFPAYDLLDMECYGRRSRNHPGLVSIEHSRGCTDNCSFCILWKHMGKHRDGSDDVRPHVRTQSPERSFETVHRLYHEFGRRTFGWVDPTFNVSPRWSDGWAELMLTSDMMDARGDPRTIHTAWMRSDCVIRDHKSGVLDKLVRAGVRQVMIGVERDDEDSLALLNKHNNDAEVTREAISIFQQHYPQVFTIGSMIYGLPGDTKDDLKRLVGFQRELGLDFCFAIPLTPNPGTDVINGDKSALGDASTDFSSYNYHTPVLKTATLDRRELEAIYHRIMLGTTFRRIVHLIRACLLEPDRRKRRLHRSFLKHGFGIAATSLFHRLKHATSRQPALHSRKPQWYDT